MVEYGFAISPGAETFVAMIPEAIHADEAIHKFDYHKRQCYLQDEKYLQYYQHYSIINCFMECSVNYTLKVR
jgi:amiloride-sensitive sodium channel